MAASFPLSRPTASPAPTSRGPAPLGPTPLGPTPLGPRFRRSSHSQGADSTCIEVAVDCAGVAVRDSKHPDGPVLRFSFAEWRVFLLGVRGGEFELPDPGSWAGHRSSESRAASSS